MTAELSDAMSLTAHYRMFGHYNAWANERVYDAAAALSAEQYRADRGAFFKSVHGTLNHLLATDRIWMKRFTGEGEVPDRLDAILYDSFAELRAARQAEDVRIKAYVDGLDAQRIAGTISYRRVSSPEAFVQQTGSRAGALVQPPDPSSRPGPRAAERAHRRGAGAGSAVFPASGSGVAAFALANAALWSARSPQCCHFAAAVPENCASGLLDAS